MTETEKRTAFGYACVGIAGAGGLGSNVAMILARAGVGKLVLVDFDRVEKGNLSRQCFFSDQIGELKVEALRRNIGRVGYGTQVATVNLMLEPGKMAAPFDGVDVSVEALDSGDTKAAFISEMLRRAPERPLVAASGVMGTGDGSSFHVRRVGALFLVEDINSNPCKAVAFVGSRVALVAAWQAHVVLQILAGVIDDDRGKR